MPGDPLVGFLYCDLASIVRGRFVPARDVERRMQTGLGWVPADQSITAFSTLAEPNPFGSVGDLRIVPDPTTRIHVDLWQDASPLDFFLCNALTLDGERWDCCPRSLFEVAVRDLRSEAGVGIVGSFEHEFQLLDAAPPAPAFSLEAQRRVEPFAAMVAAAMRKAGVDIDTFLPEFGPHQFEVPCRIAEGVAIADRSVATKEIVREVARRLGRRATFTPLQAPDAIGNGAHIHLSFVDDAGRPVTYDDAKPGRLSTRAASFAAGVLRHAPALCALASASVVSYARLTPHRWSTGIACLGDQNRETLLRISPVVTMPGHDPARQANLEFRAADATANPYLALTGLVRAGLGGIRDGLPCPPILRSDPAALTADEVAGYGAAPMPTSLADALRAFEDDQVARSWLPPRLLDAYLGVKRAEIDACENLDMDEICRRYAAVY